MSDGFTSRRRVLAAGALGLAAGTLGPVGAASAASPRRGRFDGKIVLITEATSDIGAATASAMSVKGAKGCFCGRRE